MTTRKYLSLLVLPALLLCGEAAAGGNRGGAPKEAASATAKTSTITVRKAGKGQHEYLRGVTSLGAKSSMAKPTTGTVRTSPHQPNNIGGSCPPFMCGADGNGPRLTGLQLPAGLVAIDAVTLASSEAIALR